MDSFDRIEDLAKTMCVAAGGDWDRKGTKRNYWRTQAGAALEHADADPLGLTSAWEWFCAGALSAAATLGLLWWLS